MAGLVERLVLGCRIRPFPRKCHTVEPAKQPRPGLPAQRCVRGLVCVCVWRAQDMPEGQWLHRQAWQTAVVEHGIRDKSISSLIMTRLPGTVVGDFAVYRCGTVVEHGIRDKSISSLI